MRKALKLLHDGQRNFNLVIRTQLLHLSVYQGIAVSSSKAYSGHACRFPRSVQQRELQQQLMLSSRITGSSQGAEGKVAGELAFLG